MFKWKFKQVKSAVEEGMTLEQVRNSMLQLMAEENKNHYRMGQLYNHVVRKKLAEAAGYKDAKDWFSKNLADLSQASLSTYGAVADAFSEEISVRFGVTCLYLLLIYEEAADVEVNHEQPGDTVIEVPGENGAVTSKRFGACSVEEMRKAIQRRRKPASSKPLPPGAVVLANQYSEAVTGCFPKGAPIHVQLRNHKGKAVIDFKGIPLEQVGKLAEVLMAPPPPVGPVLRVEKAPPTA